MNDIREKRAVENQKKLGLLCFQGTNDFRKSNNKATQEWCNELFYIALEHSKNMAIGKTKFGHTGFSRRAKMTTYSHRGFYENVAYCSTLETEKQLSQTVVDGWINSPGHKKNMLANATHSAVAA